MPNLDAANISLIVGFGNPGSEYAQTRHNAGFWFVEQLADKYGITLKMIQNFTESVVVVI